MLKPKSFILFFLRVHFRLWICSTWNKKILNENFFLCRSSSRNGEPGGVRKPELQLYVTRQYGQQWLPKPHQTHHSKHGGHGGVLQLWEGYEQLHYTMSVDGLKRMLRVFFFLFCFLKASGEVFLFWPPSRRAWSDGTPMCGRGTQEGQTLPRRRFNSVFFSGDTESVVWHSCYRTTDSKTHRWTVTSVRCMYRLLGWEKKRSGAMGYIWCNRSSSAIFVHSQPITPLDF